MTTSDELHPEELTGISERIRSGEYFREAQNIYDFSVHDPMAERYLYVLITILGGLILLLAFFAMEALYPLNRDVPFIFSTNDIVEDIPHIQSLLTHKGQDPSEALLNFLVKNYVTFREEYNIDTFDRDINGVKAASSPEVYKAFQQYIDPHNPESPVTLYQRHSKRLIDIFAIKPLVKDPDYNLTVIFAADVLSKGEVKRTYWQTNIAFNYSGITLDEVTGHPKPINFSVTRYQTKRLQDIQ